jgi:hypothetical protein
MAALRRNLGELLPPIMMVISCRSVGDTAVKGTPVGILFTKISTRISGVQAQKLLQL